MLRAKQTVSRPISRIGTLAALSAGLLLGGLHAASAYEDAYAWGWNANGQLGIALTYDHVPSQYLSLAPKECLLVKAGAYHSLFLDSNYNAWAVGGNSRGQLGDATTTDRSVPVPVVFGVQFVGLAAGYEHSLALSSTGIVWAWGDNSSGQLGIDGTDDHSTYPREVMGNVVAIAAAGYHSMALDRDGHVWVWGDNTYGQAGNGTSGSLIPRPTMIGVANIAKIACGAFHSMVTTADGVVMGWGLNSYGQLGPHTSGSWIEPSPVGVFSSDDHIEQIACGGYHNLALRSDGTVLSWGYAPEGELGYDAGTFNMWPKPVPGMTNCSDIACGSFHSMALRDGRVWTWGWNAYGQLCDGTTVNHTDPRRAGTLNNVNRIAAGHAHSLALADPQTADISGYVYMLGVDLSANYQNITFTLSSPGYDDIVRTEPVQQLSPKFHLTNLPRRDYTLRVRGTKWLQFTIPAPLSTDDDFHVDPQLIPGDINGDNKIDLNDLGLLADAFNTTVSSPRWNPNADLNCDYQVNIKDLGLLADYFNMHGSP
jgi:alpha-tubulin suppressor-like RCC1 family protein